MWSYLKLVACLIFFTTAFAFFGVAGAYDSGGNPWRGAIIGGVIGMVFGLALGGALDGTRLLDVLLPPGPEENLAVRTNPLDRHKDEGTMAPQGEGCVVQPSIAHTSYTPSGRSIRPDHPRRNQGNLLRPADCPPYPRTGPAAHKGGNHGRKHADQHVLVCRTVLHCSSQRVR
jgi:hypothetical protein